MQFTALGAPCNSAMRKLDRAGQIDTLFGSTAAGVARRGFVFDPVVHAKCLGSLAALNFPINAVAVRSCVMQPVQKISKSRKRKRRSHHALSPIQYVRCPQCGNGKLPHAACSNCGFVNPELALAVESKAS
jgi:large subunit ribosomal protein L32